MKLRARIEDAGGHGKEISEQFLGEMISRDTKGLIHHVESDSDFHTTYLKICYKKKRCPCCGTKHRIDKVFDTDINPNVIY